MSYKKIDLERLIFVLTTEFNLNNDDLIDYEIIRALRLMCCDYLAQSQPSQTYVFELGQKFQLHFHLLLHCPHKILRRHFHAWQKFHHMAS